MVVYMLTTTFEVNLMRFKFKVLTKDKVMKKNVKISKIANTLSIMIGLCSSSMTSKSTSHGFLLN